MTNEDNTRTTYAAERLRYAKIVVLFFIYFVTARFGLGYGAVNRFATLIWAPTGIALSALLLFGYNLWPGIVLGAFFANLSEGASIWVAACISVGNTLEALVGAYLLRRFEFHRVFDRLRDSLNFVLFAAIFSTTISATIGVTSLLVSGFIRQGGFRQTWTAWWLGDLAGALLIAPVILLWGLGTHSVRKTRPAYFAETIFLVLLVVVSSILIFTDLIATGNAVVLQPYLVFPILVVVAVRLSQRWTVTSVFIVMTVILISTIGGHGRFIFSSLSESLFQAQLFLVVFSISNLILASTVAERRRNRQQMAFLSDASRVLSESIDYRTTLRHVMQTAVPQLGDWSVVQILGDDGKTQLVEQACSVSKKEAAFRDFAKKFLSTSEPGTIAGTVVANSKSILISSLSESNYRSYARSKDLFRSIRDLRVTSLMATPLCYFGKTYGVLLLGSMTPGRRYDSRELLLFEELARRAAIAIANAHLYLEAKEAIYARDEFLSVASHELKTPLTSLSLQLQMLDRGIKKSIAASRSDSNAEEPETITLPIKSARMVSASEKHYRRLSALLDELLDLTRVRLGRLQLEKEDLDLCTIVNEVVERFQPQAHDEGIRLSAQCVPRANGHWDKMRIEQVIGNLISNAVKYGERKPILLQVEKDEAHGRIRVFVKDEGMGIAPEMKNKIFERFERAGISGQKISGLGLGLYICRQIIEAHGGTIRVESVIGKGSTFTVELPVSHTAEPPLPNTAPLSSQS